jgi:hypothetical protein
MAVHHPSHEAVHHSKTHSAGRSRRSKSGALAVHHPSHESDLVCCPCTADSPRGASLSEKKKKAIYFQQNVTCKRTRAEGEIREEEEEGLGGKGDKG